jgi:hypothetical protein
MVAALTAGSAAAGGHEHQLVLEQRYLTPQGVRTVHWDQVPRQAPEPPFLSFEPRAKDRYVRIDVADDHWEDVWINVSQAGANSDRKVIDRDMCGRNTAFELVSSKPVEVRIYDGLCETHLWSFGSSGTVKATFTPTQDWLMADQPRHHHPY